VSVEPLHNQFEKLQHWFKNTNEGVFKITTFYLNEKEPDEVEITHNEAKGIHNIDALEEVVRVKLDRKFN